MTLLKIKLLLIDNTNQEINIDKQKEQKEQIEKIKKIGIA
jgi:hypothetical protein